MKRKIEKIFTFFIRMLSFAYSYELNKRLSNWLNIIYTMWVRNFIGEVGENTGFARPLLLQGGGQRRIKIGSNTSIGHHTVLGCWKYYGDESYSPEIVIGNECCIGEYCHIAAINKITIGDGLLTGRFVYIGDNSHGGMTCEESNIPPIKRKLKTKGKIMIGKNVWVGDKVTILGGVTIGDNVIIGANTVVTNDIPSNTIVTGSKCRIVKSL